jgi:probable HAF family extracellular repeat protein
MNGRTLCVGVMIWLAMLAGAASLAAQNNQDKHHHHYNLVDLGTFGGPQSRVDYQHPINNRGTVSGSADTPDPNPFYGNDNPFFFPDAFIQHAFQFRNGVLTDLGSLFEGGTSQPNWINEKGDVAGNASNGVIDPLGSGYPESRAVLYKDGQVLDLGTLGGYESASTAINSHGTVAGFAANAIPDPIFGQQLRAFRWQDGVMQDLGTLGTGADAIAITMNEAGQIVGISFTNAVPVTDPFLWENGKMTDLGGLGGTASDVFEGPWMNERGQVVGDSNVPGDLYFHPYLWTKTGPMQDLGTLGGNYGAATWVNNGGEVIGWATNAGDHALLAFLWKKGKMINLGTVDGDACSTPWGLNEKHQVVGASGDCNQNLHAFLWEKGSTVDLNTLIPPGSGVQLNYATHINERGEITVFGAFPNGDNQGFLLIPCDENHPSVEGCNYSLAEGSTAAFGAGPAVRKPLSQGLPLSLLRQRWLNIPFRATTN